MSIRSTFRDLNSPPVPQLAVVEPESISPPESVDPLLFYNVAQPPVLIDLREFRDGWRQPNNHYQKKLLFRGRPKLIEELSPALKDRMMFFRLETARKFLESLRSWWRFFDRLESTGFEKVARVTQLTDTMGLLAAESISYGSFLDFRSIVDATHQAMRRPPTFWLAPAKPSTRRTLAPEEHFSRLWQALKRGWFASVNRANRLNALEAGTSRAELPQDELLVKALNAKKQAKALAESEGRGYWTIDDLAKVVENLPAKEVRPDWEIYAALFVTPTEARFAFHLFLAGSRWNTAPALTLKVDTNPDATSPTPFIHEHPENPGRYTLVGFKERGFSEPDVDGDWKTDRSPGAIVRAIVERTWPLRLVLLHQLRQAKSDYLEAKAIPVAEDKLRKLYENVQRLEAASTSVWLYVHRGQVCALDSRSYRGNTQPKFLDRVIATINQTLPPEKHLAKVTASDLRDAFVAYAWTVTGGSVLQIQKELNHRRLGSTVIYLDNTRVNAESAQVFRTLCDTMFDLLRSGKVLDPTVVAKIIKDGSMSEAEHVRLEDYRTQRKSRIGVACKDPKNPPKHISPDFVANGRSECVVQRCTLCLENAVIGPESLDGLSMRAEELVSHESTMPMQAFSFSRFKDELERTELALKGFDPTEVRQRREYWRRRIDDGTHRPPEFNGAVVTVLTRKP